MELSGIYLMTAYERSRRYSDEKLGALRARLQGNVPEGDVVLTCGSYARREASDNSDIDFFVITQEDQADGSSGELPASLSWVDEVKGAINEIVPTEPSAGGAFAKVENYDSMLRNIGGENDSNQKLTRRMLFLLEGEWLTNPDGLRRARRQILERYISPAITDHQLALFLLNDIIRYYRTMAVDYEFKTGEGESPKPWGIRNIKLIFSRKLLYASGLFSVALTADLRHERKIETLENLFDLPVIDRMTEICGPTKLERVRQSYNRFLEQLEDPKIRDHLNQLSRDQRTDSTFRDLKNEGHHFTRELVKLFENTFDNTHPIRRAVLF